MAVAVATGAKIGQLRPGRVRVFNGQTDVVAAAFSPRGESRTQRDRNGLD